MMNMMNMPKRKALLLVPIAMLVAASAMTLGGCGAPSDYHSVRIYERQQRAPATPVMTGPQDRGGGGEGGGGGGSGGGGGGH
jgi:hypothetical protein